MVNAMRSAGLIVLGVLLLAACSNVPGADGRYATPGRGGWDNFRAESPQVGGKENFRADATPPNSPVRSPDM